MGLSRLERNVELYKTMYLIRHAEEKICKHYHEDDMKTPTHLCIGAEAIEASVCSAMSEMDQIFGTYRSHGIYLAKGGQLGPFYAELCGRKDGIAKGKTGSMHLTSVECGFLGASAIVGSTIPLALGAAFANKKNKNEKIVYVFFGDGAIEEGAFWESVNVACLMKLPIVFVCEDNELAIHSSLEDRRGFRHIAQVMRQFECCVFESSSTDCEELYEITLSALDSLKTTGKPSFLHFKYYRYYEHVGVREDFEYGYRDRADFLTWRARDPLQLQKHKLGLLGFKQDKLNSLEVEILRDIDEKYEMALNSDIPAIDELYRDVLA